MASPCSHSSSSSSPYSNPSPSTSGSPSPQPTPSPDNEQPCCSQSLSVSSPSTSSAVNTANNTSRAAKRKISEVDGSSETDGRPRKCTKKTHHITTTSPSSSRAQKRRASSSPSPQPQKRLKVPSCFYSSEGRRMRKTLNAQYLTQFQQECHQAASNINLDELVAADVWKHIVQNTPENPGPEPIVLFKRLLNNPTRLHWKKLQTAFSMLTIVASGESPSRLGPLAASQAVRWLKSLFANLDTNLGIRSRHLMCGSTFTRLCGQALASQRAPILPIHSTPPTPSENQMCFVSGDDFLRASADPTVLGSEHAVVYLKHPDGPRNSSSVGHNGQYPIIDFEESSEQNNQ